MKQEMIKDYLHDIGIAASLGLISGLILSILFFLIGFLNSGFEIYSAANIYRSGMLILTGLGFFLAAAMLLTKKGMVSIANKEKWRQRFYRLHYTGVIIVICLMFLIYAIGADYFVISLMDK